MKNLLFIYLFFLLLIFSGCTKDSPLSDLEFTDPGLIKPYITISRSTSSSGTVSFSEIVWVYDKNNNSIDIQNGKVLINEILLSLKKEPINKAPYYSVDPASQLPFEFDKSYKCTIVLSDEKEYVSNVTSRSKDIEFFIVPANHNKTEDMILRWGPPDSNEDIKLKMSYSFKNDTSGGVGVRNIQISNPQNGEAIISKSFFEPSTEVYEATFTLESNIYGTINKNFMPGSQIYFNINISKKTKFE